MSSKIIEVKDLSIVLGKKKVLNDLSFQVEEKEIFGFLGPSGAGKTTTIKLLTKQLLSNRGSCKVRVEKEKIGILSDNSGCYERLTVYRNLCFFAEISKTKKEKIEEVLRKVKLYDDKDKKVKDLSKGMKQRLLLACAVIHSPKLLFLDEPTAALDPATTEEIHKLLWQLREEGTTIFLTTHNMEEADKLCNRVAFLNKGEIVEIGKPSELKLKYANNTVDILFENYKKISIDKDVSSIMKCLKENSKESLKSIHSQEPNLAEIFLKLTGRDLK